LEATTAAALAVPPEALGRGSAIGVSVVADNEALIRRFADDLYEHYRAGLAAGRARVVFIVPVGPVGQFDRLAERCNRDRLSLDRLVLIGMDEYLTPSGAYIAIDDPLSFRRHVEDHFYRRLDPALAPPAENRVFPDPGEPEATTRLIARLGGVDVCFGGVGITGHVAFNDPPEPDQPDDVEAFALLPTRVVRLSRETILINAVTAAKGNVDRIPRLAVTVGMREILASRKVRLFMNRPWQCAIVRKLLHGPVTARVPASLLRRHPDCHVTLTAEVAQLPEPELR
jgi:glucosamine-6-phosphate deaminase